MKVHLVMRTLVAEADSGQLSSPAAIFDTKEAAERFCREANAAITRMMATVLQGPTPEQSDTLGSIVRALGIYTVRHTIIETEVQGLLSVPLCPTRIILPS